MYVRCLDCGWDSGDFGYNTPTYYLKLILESLKFWEIYDRKNRINKQCWFKRTIKITNNKYIHFRKRVFKYFIKSIKHYFIILNRKRKGHIFKTYDDFKKYGKCPVCSSSNWGVD